MRLLPSQVMRATRHHDISCGHRVYGHEGKCRNLHGHNYRVHFTLVAEKLDSVGRVLDFSVIKSKLCDWLETHWDHKMLLWEKDPIVTELDESLHVDCRSIVVLPFNPTAENLAKYLVEVIAPNQLRDTGTRLVKVVVEETRKCSAEYEVTP